MIVTIKAQDTGKNDYFEDENLLTKAIELEGYTDVYINWNEWNGTRSTFFGLRKVKEDGQITTKANKTIKYLSENKSTKDTVVNLKQK